MKQTAINWLIDQIRNEQNQKALTGKEWMEVIEQARRMEREQIIDAYTIGSYDMAEKEFRPEEYYNETYGE